jgi:hypothetical protein
LEFRRLQYTVGCVKEVGRAKGPWVVLDSIEGCGFFQCKAAIDGASNSLALELVLFFEVSLLVEVIGWAQAFHYHNRRTSSAEVNN